MRQVIFHHVGSENSRRDFPRTIGTPSAGIRRFSYDKLIELSEYITKSEREVFLNFLKKNSTNHFQIWGIPSGAISKFHSLSIGDVWMLLDSPHTEGGMHYIGRVDYKIDGKQFDLSRELWTESRFPHIFLMHGNLIFYPWFEFLSLIKYKETYDPRGHVCGVSREKIKAAGFENDDAFVNFVLSTYSIREV